MWKKLYGHNPLGILNHCLGEGEGCLLRLSWRALTDVTLLIEDAGSVCKYFQNGYCKFGVRCRKCHNIEACDDETCD